MASEIRVDKINSLSGVGTVTLSPTGVDIAGITTVATLKATTGIVTTLTATTGIVTTLTANTVTSLGAVSGTTGTFSGAVSGTTGTFTGDVDIADKIVHTGDTDTAIRFSGANTVSVETAGSERLRILSGGSVNIGNSISQTSRLFTVENTLADGGEIVYIGNNDGASNYGGLIISAGETDRECRLESAWGNSFMTFYTVSDAAGSTEKLRITKDGDLGLNVSSPSAKLDVVDDSASGYIAEFRQSNTSNSGQIAIDSPTDSDARPVLIDMQRAGTTKWSIGQGYNSSGGAFHLATSSLAGGVTGVKASFLTGGGLTFNGDTAAANALDDYEEGTWTPTVNGTNSNLTHRASRYIKIGNLVQLQVEFYTSAGNFSTGANLNLTNLPFFGPASPMHVVGSVAYMNSAYGMTLMTNYMNSSSQWYFSQATGSGLYLWANISYRTAS